MTKISSIFLLKIFIINQKYISFNVFPYKMINYLNARLRKIILSQVSPTSAVARADRVVLKAVQAAEGEQKALPGADERGARGATRPRRSVRGRGGHARRRAPLHTLEGKVSSKRY